MDNNQKDWEQLAEEHTQYILEFERKDIRDTLVSKLNVWRTPTILAFKIVADQEFGYEAIRLNMGECIVPLIYKLEETKPAFKNKNF